MDITSLLTLQARSRRNALRAARRIRHEREGARQAALAMERAIEVHPVGGRD